MKKLMFLVAASLFVFAACLLYTSEAADEL